MTATSLARTGDHWTGSFVAMASPCEILLDLVPVASAQRALRAASREAWRIEQKFSRYRTDSVVARIHAAAGAPTEVDDETAGLLDFGALCWKLSGGRFDLTSGVLRRAWRFDGSDRIPSEDEIERLRPLVGWTRVAWERPRISLPEGMEIDFGGIGKEYAVDRVAGLLAETISASFLVNFGGDLRASGARGDGRPWSVGIEDPGAEDQALRRIEVCAGALATSGDSRRFLLKDSVRYSHVLDPRTCRPVAGAPRSVTVEGATCTEAGMLATFALLHGPDAETFLAAEGARSWCVR